MRLPLFCALFGLFYMALDGFVAIRMAAYLWGREDVLRPEIYALVYLAAYGLGLAGWVGLHAHASRALRYGSYAITWLTGTVYLGFAQINTGGYSITQAELFWEEIEFVTDAGAFFAGTWLPPAIGIAAVIALFEWSLGSRMTRLRSKALLLAPIAATAAFYSILERSDARLEQFPVPYRVGVLTAYAYSHQVVWLGVRDAPVIRPSAEPMAAHIVFIVDESIRGDWLGVNGGRFDTTPFLSSLSSHPEAFFNDSFFNYGVASATANLSGPANLILQSGLRPAELPDVDMRSMKNPNLFSYLQTAGFATFFIDAQHSFGRPPNFMTQADVEALDGYLVIRDTDKEVEEWDVDRLILPELSRIIRSHERSFSYVLKIGAHFPYSVRYPPEAAAFEAIDLGDAYDARQATIIREYLDTLRHGVDDFCRELVRTLAATGQDVVVLYTADHGQSLFEPWGSEAKRIRGHGHSPEPPSYQARVPVFILAFGDGPRNTLAESFDESLLNRTSAFELFPTLLRMAGFSREDIASRYHHSLFDRDADRSHRVFSSGNHFGTDGPLYRSAPYRSSFGLNDFLDSPPGPDSSPDDAQAPDWR